MKHTRRRLLQIIVASGLWGGGAEIFARFSRFAADSDDSAMLTSLLENKESARIIGDEYLRVNPQENDRDLLEGALSYSSVSDLFRADYRDFRANIVSQVRADYELGSTVMVGGWVLSQTEARLCALVSLSSPS